MLLNDLFGLFPVYLSPEDDGGGGDDADTEDVKEPEDEVDPDEITEDDEEPIEEWDPDRAKNTILKQRENERRLARENKIALAKLAKYEKAEKEKADAEKSELQKASERNSELETENTELKGLLQEERIQRHVEIEAYKMGFVDPSDAYDLLVANDKLFELIDYNDEGLVKGHMKALKELSEQKPYLIETEQSRRATPKRDAANRLKPKKLDDLPATEVLGVPTKL